jgi:hypothetical protein
MLIIISLVQKIVPYRDKFFWNIQQDGGELTEKLALIKVNNEFFRKHLEYRVILKKYSKSTILPSMPEVSYLYNKKNPFIIDWSMDVEANYNRNLLIKKINACCSYVIVEKRNLGQPIGSKGKFYSSVTNYVINNFKLVDRSYIYFDIYQRNY